MIKCTNLRLRTKKGMKYMYCVKKHLESTLKCEICLHCEDVAYKEVKKMQRKKKKQKELEDSRYSILTIDLTRCFVCGSKDNIAIHEVYFGRNRLKSIQYGCCVPLCLQHHTNGKYGVHFDKKLDNLLKYDCQKAFMKKYNKTENEFAEIFWRNYL